MRSTTFILTVGLSTAMLSAQPQTEWHFGGGLNEVAGPARLRFLDDGAFGTPLGGGAIGQTEAQSEFGDSRSLGVDPIAGASASAMRISAPLGADGAPSRSIGLVLWPGTGQMHPDGLVRRWTIVMDMYVPSASWSSDWPVALMNFDDNNGDDADLFIAGPAVGGSPLHRIGTKSMLIETPLLVPDTWMRLVIAVDDETTHTTSLYINGDPVGVLGFSASLNDLVDPDNPTYIDGMTVDPGLWQRWGEFPSPWAPMASTLTLFSDDDGEGGGVVIANLYLTERTMSGSEAGGLDEPDPDRVVLCDVPCAADFNNDCVGDVFDLLDFLSVWFPQDPQADYNFDTVVDVFDLLDYLTVWFQGC